MVILILATKDLRLLLRDPRSALVLFAMPLAMILVLSLSIGGSFGRKPDDRIRLSVVIEDAGLSEDLDELPPPNLVSAVTGSTAFVTMPTSNTDIPQSRLLGAIAGSAIAATHKKNTAFPPTNWSDVLLGDLSDTADIRVERIATRAEAERLVKRGERAAVVIFHPEFSERVHRCSFVGPEFKKKPINPLYRDGVQAELLGVEVIENKTQPVGSSVIKQVIQVSLLRVIIPWMIGQAFDNIGSEKFMDKMEASLPKALKSFFQFVSKTDLGRAIKEGIKNFFIKYDFNAKTWAGLTKSKDPAVKDENRVEYKDQGGFGLKRGTVRYQTLVPSYTVTFAFFLTLVVGWLFVAERRHNTLVRLQAAPISRTQLLFGKFLPCYAVSLFQGFFLLLCGKLIFGMSWGPEPWLLIPVVASTSFAAVGMAMIVAVLSKTETQVSVFGTLVVLLLAGISGSMMPREMMPEEMRLISQFTPHTWALDAYSALLHPDHIAVDVGEVLWASAALAGFGCLFTFVAWVAIQIQD